MAGAVGLDYLAAIQVVGPASDIRAATQVVAQGIRAATQVVLVSDIQAAPA